MSQSTIYGDEQAFWPMLKVVRKPECDCFFATTDGKKQADIVYGNLKVFLMA
jgi:hypothetical protein